MKKTVVLAALGLAAAVTAYGQANIVFSSYVSNGGNGNTTTIWATSTLIGSPYTAILYYAAGSVSDPVDIYNPQSIISPVSGSFTQVASSASLYDNSGAATGTQGLGYFDGSIMTIPIAGYNGTTPISFEIVAFNGSSWATSTIRGRSGAWTESTVEPVGQPAGNLGDHGTVPNMYVEVVPEPATLALAGLGGLAGLMAFRRKQA